MQLTKDYFEAREAAMEWLNRNPKHRDYTVGVEILIKSGYKSSVAQKIKRIGEQPWTVEKLHYCLREMIQMYYAPDDPRFSENEESQDPDILNSETPKTITPEAASEVIKEQSDKTKFEDMPHVMQVIIRTFSDAYKKRDILHRKLSSLPEDNGDETVKERASLAAEIDSLSDLMDRLYQLKSQYKKDGILPDIDSTNQILTESTINNKVHVDKEEDLTTLTKEQLQIRHHSLINQIRRKENMLIYQSASKKTKENQMPDCPKRVKIENQITKFKKTLERVDYALAKFI